MDWICIVCPAQVKHLRDLETSDWSAEFSCLEKLPQKSQDLPIHMQFHLVVQPLEDRKIWRISSLIIHWIARSWQLKLFASFCILQSLVTEDFRLSLHEVAPRWYDPSCWHAGDLEISRSNFAGFKKLRCSFSVLLVKWHIGIGGWTFLVKWWSNWW